MVEAPSSGGPGSPMMQNGVVTDGSYEIIGSQGRFLLLGIATNRPDAVGSSEACGWWRGRSASRSGGRLAGGVTMGRVPARGG